MTEIEKIRPTFSLTEDRLNALKQILPEAFSDGHINFETLRELLGDDVEDERDEHFGLSWTGKREARRLAGLPSKGTLIPVPGEGVDEATTENIFIEGDNLEVLKLLHKSYRGRVKMIYIDPPYNTGNDFIYKDDYREPLESYLERSGQMTDAGELLSSNPKSTGRFHSNWLNMMYPRLRVAKDLLREDGLIFISINDIETYNLKPLLNEIFGEENYIATFVWQSKKGGGSDSGNAVVDHEYVLCFGMSESRLLKESVQAEELDCEDEKGKYRRGRELNKWGSNSRRIDRPTMFFPIPGPNGEEVYPIRNDGVEGCWRYGKENMLAFVERGDAEFVARGDGNFTVYEKIRTTDPRSKPFRTWLTDVGTTADGSKAVKELFDDKKVFDFAKPLKLLKTLIRLAANDDGNIVLDFFAGSGSTAHAVLEANVEDEITRNFICVQIPEETSLDSDARLAGFNKIPDVTKERIRRAIKKIKSDKSADSPLLQQSETSDSEKQDLGFKVFRLERSNFRAWTDFTGQELADFRPLLETFESPFVAEAVPEGVLTEILLLEGFPLNSNTQIDDRFERNKVVRVSSEFSEHRLFITLDEEIWEETIDHAAELEKNDIFICLDNALSDENKVRLADVCRLKTI